MKRGRRRVPLPYLLRILIGKVRLSLATSLLKRRQLRLQVSRLARRLHLCLGSDSFGSQCACKLG